MQLNYEAAVLVDHHLSPGDGVPHHRTLGDCLESKTLFLHRPHCDHLNPAVNPSHCTHKQTQTAAGAAVSRFCNHFQFLLHFSDLILNKMHNLPN